MKGKIYITSAIMMIAAMALAFGCAPKAAPSTEQPAGIPKTEILKIGVADPLTGSGATWGAPILRAATLRAEQVNAEGGVVIGGTKYEIKVIAEDTKFMPAPCLAAMEKLITVEKVKYIDGPCLTPGIIAARSLINEYKPIVFFYGANPLGLSSETPYVFRFCSTFGEYIPAIFEWIKGNHPEVKTVAYISRDYDTGRAGAAEVRENSRLRGFDFLDAMFYPAGTEDFYSYLTRLMSMNPDCIWLGATPGEVGLLSKQLNELGYEGLRCGPSHYVASDLAEIAGKEAVEGFVYSIDIDKGPLATDKILEWCKDYEARWGTFDMAIGIAPLDLLLQAWKKCDSLDTTKVKEALESLKDVDGYNGKGNWGGEARYGIAHQLLFPVAIVQIQDGEAVGLEMMPPVEPPPFTTWD